jgi:xanthine dehydrogenase iron-sulfur cluster and FAD-binding subunit A
MNQFEYVRPASVADAIAAAAAPGATYLASGTNLLDLMKGGIMRPARLVDVSRLPGLDRIERLDNGDVRIGALVRNADLAHDLDFARSHPRDFGGPALRRFRPVAQCGHRRRQSVAADPLQLFLRHGQRMQ